MAFILSNNYWSLNESSGTSVPDAHDAHAMAIASVETQEEEEEEEEE